ncbi:hypothetical protein BROC_00457 [Candidatus Brocadiaceae bacterium]|nr:hypothetical protein BROC_00457 [Candidatus Brocadiaceae bacterium]
MNLALVVVGKNIKNAVTEKNIFNNSTKSKNIHHILPPHVTINYVTGITKIIC